MRRMTFDTLVSVAGLLLVGVLLVAGGLLAWTSSYINNEVSTQLSAQKITFPAANSAAVNTVFRGETLRGLLLNAYAFGTIGMIAGIAAVVAFIGAGILLLLSLLGLYHSRRVSPTKEILNIN